jgi:hypothetical protein
MPRSTMLNDGGKPENKLPPAFQPGAGVVEGRIEMWRDNVRWHVMGYDSSGRVFARLADGTTTAWLGPRRG